MMKALAAPKGLRAPEHLKRRPLQALAAPFSVNQVEAPVAGLTLEKDSVCALKALEAVLRPIDFWKPSVLDQVPSEAVDALLDARLATPKLRERLAQARELWPRPTNDRVCALSELLKGAPKDEGVSRALAWAAGLPLEIAGNLTEERALLLPYSAIRWLPGGLSLIRLHGNDAKLESIEGPLRVDGAVALPFCPRLRTLPMGMVATNLDVSYSTLESLPNNLQVRGYIWLNGCHGFRELPRGFSVERLWAKSSGLAALPKDLEAREHLDIRETPLVRFTDEEIRVMAPGVTGKIWR
jgi:hypothetical protein